MMKILLLNPSAIKKNYTILPNIGLGYIATAVKTLCKSTILDAVLEKLNPEKFSYYIRSNKVDILGISIFSRTLYSAKMYLESAKRECKNIQTIAGGPHAIFEPEETMNYLGTDYAFSGEAEEGLPQLLEALENNRTTSPETLSDIPNLVWRDTDGKIVVNPRKYVDVNKHPIPAWELIHPERYPVAPNGIFSRARKIAPVVVTRGCPYPCTFCGAGIASGKKLRKRNIENVIEEIKLLRDKHGIEEIHIMDDNFTLDMNYAKEVCRAITKENLKMLFACPNGIRLDRIDEELLKLMERAGFYSFAVGIESGSQTTLDNMKKGIKIEEIKENIDMIKRVSNIEVTGFFIIGYPNETVKDVAQTIRLSRELRIDKANFFNFTPFPGSEEYIKLKKEGKLKKLDYDKLYIHQINFHSEKISKRMLKWLQIKAHILFYMRPRILIKLLKEIKTFSQVKIILYRVTNIIF